MEKLLEDERVGGAAGADAQRPAALGALRRTALLWGAALAAGCLAAVSIYGFRLLIRGVEWLFTGRTGSFPDAAEHLALWERVLIPTLGGILAGAVLQAERRLSAAPHVDYIEAARVRSPRLNDRSTAARTVSSLLSVGSGSSIGREGSMVQLAAWLAASSARLLPLDAAERNAILVCGIAAGLASAYHAPIAGVVFVLELALGFFARHAVAPVLVAGVTASALTQRLIGAHPLYEVPGIALAAPQLGVVLVAGALFGLLGLGQLALLERSRRWFRLVRPLWLRLALGGLAVGVVSAITPGVWGNGYSVITQLLRHGEVVTIVLALLVGKLFATIASAGSGSVGGVFTPTLFVGATSGFLVSGLAAGLLGAAAVGDPRALGVIGMGAVLAAVTHAPLMSIVMVLEMTHQFQLAVPVMLASAVSYAISAGFSVKPVYGNPIEGGTQLRSG
jgi:chloride channel protein, CIC family